HQVDAARFVAGGMARSVRASAWILDPARPTEGCYAAFLTFENGAVASLVYSGYDHLESSGAARRALQAAHTPEEETELRVKSGYSSGQSSRNSGQRMSLMQPELGVFVATCAEADLRLVPEGVAVYSNDGLQVIPAAQSSRGDPGRGAVLDELSASVFAERPP